MPKFLWTFLRASPAAALVRTDILLNAEWRRVGAAAANLLLLHRWGLLPLHRRCVRVPQREWATLVWIVRCALGFKTSQAGISLRCSWCCFHCGNWACCGRAARVAGLAGKFCGGSGWTIVGLGREDSETNRRLRSTLPCSWMGRADTKGISSSSVSEMATTDATGKEACWKAAEFLFDSLASSSSNGLLLLRRWRWK